MSWAIHWSNPKNTYFGPICFWLFIGAILRIHILVQYVLGLICFGSNMFWYEYVLGTICFGMNMFWSNMFPNMFWAQYVFVQYVLARHVGIKSHCNLHFMCFNEIFGTHFKMFSQFIDIFFLKTVR